jgi:FMN phosphatase YigB (HAD superfamily)
MDTASPPSLSAKLSAHPAVAAALQAFSHAAELAERLDQASCISFDFFDTLFARPFAEPEFVFDLLGRRLGMADFRQKRVAAQAEAFRRMRAQGRKEIRLNDIYACFDAPAEQQAHWAQAEAELELALLAPKPEVLRLFHALRAAGAQLAICSDMYFPRDFFENALRQHRIDVVEILLVSAEENATKRDAGELFDVLVQMSGQSAESVLHIGDHAMADIQRAQERGLMAFHYDAKPSTSRERAERAYTLHGLWERCKTEANDSLFERLGFLYGGPANLGYLQWLAEQCRNDGIEHLLFLSRDGFLLERLAKHKHVQGHVRDLPPFHYFTGSRVAYYLAAITEKNFSTYIPFLLSGCGGLKPRELLERIGVTPPAEQVMRDLGLGAEVSITQQMQEQLASFLFAWRTEILKVCARNRRALRLYLDSLGIHSGAKVGLVDVGWSGSTQEAFLAAVSPWMDVNVTGYYFCLADTPERLARDKAQNMRAMITSITHNAEFIDQIYRKRSIVELFFSAPHATVIGWQTNHKNGQVESIMDIGRGSSPKTLQLITHDISAAAEYFVDCYQSMCKHLGATLTPSELAGALLHLTVHEDAQCRAFSTHIVNFDTWSSSVNHRMDLTLYE